MSLDKLLKNDQFPEAILVAVKRLKKNGFQAYLVGGSIRDILLGREPHDFDLTTDATPNQVITLFNKTIPTGLQHGTVTVVIDHEQIEITTYRIDGDYGDNRHPDSVIFTPSLKEDLKRRDFTINAFAWDPIDQHFVDYFDGIGDLNNKIIRAIGVPADRFNEDGLRMIRAVRFAAQLGFKIESKTFIALTSLIDLLNGISMERKRDELMKILMAPKPSIGFELLRISGILADFLPELQNCYGVVQNKYHIYDVYGHILAALDGSIAEPTVRLALLCHDLGKPDVAELKPDGTFRFLRHEERSAEITKELLMRLKFSNKIIKDVSHLVLHHMVMYEKRWKNSAVRRFIQRVGGDYLDLLETVRTGDMSAGNPEYRSMQFKELFQRAREMLAAPQEHPVDLKALNLSGGDLIKYFDLKPSPQIGAILKALLERVIEEPKLNHREQLLILAEDILDNMTV